MARLMAKGAGPSQAIEERSRGFQFEQIPDRDVHVLDLRAGLVTSTNIQERPPGSALVLENMRWRNEGLEKRDGYVQLGQDKPNSNAVRGIFTARLEGNLQYVTNVQDYQIYAALGDALWTEIVPDPDAAVAPVLEMSTVPPRFAQFFDKVYITNNVNHLLEIDYKRNVFNEYEDAPVAKFGTNFADRIVVANSKAGIKGAEGGAFTVHWSKNADPRVWDDISSGTENLIQNPTDIGDEITGIFGLTNTMVILRERSIWEARRQPFARAPFEFRAIIPNQGCNLPYSAVVSPHGVIYADQRRGGVYMYSIGKFPQYLSAAIEEELRAALDGADIVRAEYTARHDEYYLSIVTGTTEIAYVLSVLVGTWTKDTGFVNMTALGLAPQPPAVVMINDETRMINVVTDTINSFEPDEVAFDLTKGFVTGEIVIEDPTAQTDLLQGVATDFEMTWQSQNWVPGAKSGTMKSIMLELEAESSTREEYSIEQSNDLLTWKGKDVTSLPVTNQKFQAGLRKQQISGNHIYWRIRSFARLRITEYWMRVLEKAWKTQTTPPLTFVEISTTAEFNTAVDPGFVFTTSLVNDGILREYLVATTEGPKDQLDLSRGHDDRTWKIIPDTPDSFLIAREADDKESFLTPTNYGNYAGTVKRLSACFDSAGLPYVAFQQDTTDDIYLTPGPTTYVDDDGSGPSAAPDEGLLVGGFIARVGGEYVLTWGGGARTPKWYATSLLVQNYDWSVDVRRAPSAGVDGGSPGMTFLGDGTGNAYCNVFIDGIDATTANIEAHRFDGATQDPVILAAAITLPYSARLKIGVRVGSTTTIEVYIADAVTGANEIILGNWVISAAWVGDPAYGYFGVVNTFAGVGTGESWDNLLLLNTATTTAAFIVNGQLGGIVHDPVNDREILAYSTATDVEYRTSDDAFLSPTIVAPLGTGRITDLARLANGNFAIQLLLPDTLGTALWDVGRHESDDPGLSGWTFVSGNDICNDLMEFKLPELQTAPYELAVGRQYDLTCARDGNVKGIQRSDTEIELSYEYVYGIGVISKLRGPT